MRVAEPWRSIAGFTIAAGALGAVSGRPWTAVASVAAYVTTKLTVRWWQNRRAAAE